MKTGIKWIERDLVLSPVHIGLCLTEKDFEKELKRLKIPVNECSPWIPDDKDGKRWEFQKIKNAHEQCCIVCIRRNRKHTKEEIIGLIIHESVHVWQSIKEIIGETNPSPEFEAYSIQTIAQKLITAYNKREES